MRIKLACIGITFFSTTLAMANEQFTGIFNGTGRACNGTLYLKTKTVEWHSTYSQCQSQKYRVIEHLKTNEQHKIVLVMKNPNKKCLYPVVAISHNKRYSWNINGYQSIQAYQNKDFADWKISTLPERQWLSCVMTGPWESKDEAK